MSRRKLPISQRHRKGCRRARGCDCPWRPRVQIHGKWAGRTWPTYAEAEAEYHELMARKPGTLLDHATTIAQWAPRWRTARDAGWRTASRQNADSSLRRHILPYFGDWKVTEVRYDDVTEFVAWMRGQGAGQAALLFATGYLRDMYRFWLETGRALPSGNPVHPGIIRRRRPARMVHVTGEQVESIAGHARPELAIVVRWEYFYAARAGEILGLRTENITFTGKDESASLAGQLARLAGLPADRYRARCPQVAFTHQLDRWTRQKADTKNAGAKRTLGLPQALCRQLAEHLARWPEIDGWLFTNPRGQGDGGVSARPLPWAMRMYLRWFHIACDEAGVVLPPRRATHMLKHARVRHLRDLGWSDEDIAEWTGNDEQTLTSVYGKRTRTAMADRADELAELIGQRALRVVQG